MIFLSFLTVGFLASAALKKGYIKPAFLSFVLFTVYVISLFPSKDIPYIIDDLDHLFNVSAAIEQGHLQRWLFHPHNEHVIPVLKWMYYIFYKTFWLYPQAFHFTIMIIATSVLFLSYQLIYKLTNCHLCALFTGTILASSNLSDQAIFVITNSHVVFCLFFLLLMFYSQYAFSASGKKIWLFWAFLSSLFAPLTFALGLTSVFFAFLFQKLCIPSNLQQGKRTVLFTIAIGWVLSSLLYANAIGDIIYTPHYRDLGVNSAFSVMRIPLALIHLLYYFLNDLLTLYLPNLYLSLIIFIVLILIAIKYIKQVEWKKIIFFQAVAIGLSFIIYVFRVVWGPNHISFSRYDVIPSCMLALSYGIMIQPLLQDKKDFINKSFRLYIIVFLCFAMVAFSSSIRFKKSTLIAQETFLVIQRFNIEFRRVFIHYFNENPAHRPLQIKNNIYNFSKAPSYIFKDGTIPDLTRYPRNNSFYAQIILPMPIKKHLFWGAKTDPAFLEFLEKHKETYPFIYGLGIFNEDFGLNRLKSDI